MKKQPRILPKARAALVNCALEAWYAAAVSGLVIITGLLGSTHSTEIRQTIPFVWRIGPPAWSVILFWSLFSATSFLYFMRQRALIREQKKLQNSASAQSARLERLIRTLPPEDFLKNFSTLYAAADDVLTENLGASAPRTREEVEQGIRLILQMIAVLAQKFDGDKPEVTYSGNVMLFIPAEGITAENRASIADRLMFCDEAIGLENLLGVLDLQVALSTTAGSAEALADPAMKPLALPVPKTSRSGGRFKVLPGAPLAFHERKPDLYSDTRTLAKRCAEDCDFTLETISRVTDFFEKSPVRGFVSIPLFHNANENEDPRSARPFAILNVHCDCEQLLAKGQGESFVNYNLVTTPFRIMLVKLLELLQVRELPTKLKLPE